MVTNVWRGFGWNANCEVLTGVTKKAADTLADVGLYMMTHPDRDGNDAKVDAVPPTGAQVELTSSQRDELAVQFGSLGSDREKQELLQNALQDSYQPSVPDDYAHRNYVTKGRDLRSLVYGHQ